MSEQSAAPTTESAEGPADRIATGYAVAGPAVELGSVVHDGRPHPGAAVRVPLSMLNRHGLIAGATGTGKTKTLQLIVEQLSAAGVPVVVADIKGDLSGLAQPGAPSERTQQRAVQTGDDWQPTGFPVEFLALGGLGTGVPVRATLTDFGPLRPVEPPPEESALERVLGSAAFRSFTRSAASALGRELTWGLFGTRRRRR